MNSLLQRLGLPTSWPTLQLIEWHQAASHFPVALLLSSLFFAGSGAAFKNRGLRDAAYWTHFAGALGALVTFALGWWGNPYRGQNSEIALRADIHKWWALASLILFVLLALWRIARRDNLATRERWVFHGLYALGCAILAITGYLGGHLGG